MSTLLSKEQTERLYAMAAEHERWLEGREGARLHLLDEDCSFVDLAGFKLSRAVLRGACFLEACLIKADLSRASLQSSILSVADLSGANLRGAHLEGALAYRASFEGAK